MIAWVDSHCRDWGAHKRWLEYGEHGWPPLTIIGRIMTEGAGAGQGSYRARIPIKDDPPNYTSVNIALQRMALTKGMYVPARVVEAHYVFGGKAKEKAPKLALSVRQYWQLLHAAHAFIAACDVPRDEEVCAQNRACA